LRGDPGPRSGEGGQQVIEGSTAVRVVVGVGCCGVPHRRNYRARLPHAKDGIPSCQRAPAAHHQRHVRALRLRCDRIQIRSGPRCACVWGAQLDGVIAVRREAPARPRRPAGQHR
jgi:hypothetical protein